MFLTEFFTILFILAFIMLGYKFRYPIIRWLKTKPEHDVRTGLLRDLETLSHYGIANPADYIVEKERELAESKAELAKKLKEMRDSVYDKGEAPEIKGEE